MRITILLLLTLALLLPVGCGEGESGHEHHDDHSGEEAGHAEPHEDDNLLTIEAAMLGGVPIATAAAVMRREAEAVVVAGGLEPSRNAYAEVASPVTARIVRFEAAAGERVRAGQILAVAESPELGRARAAYDTAAARAAVARETAERKRSLAERIVPRREVQQAEAEAAAAEAELTAAVAALQALGAGTAGSGATSRFALVSPLAGVVLERNLALGQMIDPQRVAFRVGDLSELWLVARASEGDAVRVAIGAPAEVTLAAWPGEVFAGRVSYVGSEVDPATGTIPVRVVLPNGDQRLRPGMSASVRLPLAGSDRSVAALPAAALQRLDDRWVVFLPKGEQSFEIRPVVRGRDLPRGEVEITEGLRDGEQVVVDGAFLLKAEAAKAEGGGDHHDH